MKKFKQKIKTFITYIIKNKYNSLFIDILYIVLKIINFKKSEIKYIDITIESILLKPSSAYKVVAPKWINMPDNFLEGTFENIYAHCFKNGIVNPYCEGIIVDNNIYLPRSVVNNIDRFKIDTAGLFVIEKELILSRIKPTHKINEGILIGGSGAYNWYHFIIECLPKALLAQKLPKDYDRIPLIVPIECKSISSFREAIKLFSKQRDLLYVKRGDILMVERLTVLDNVSYGPFNMINGSWPKVEDYSQHDNFILDYIKYLRTLLLSSNTSKKEKSKIFLTRPDTRRLSNQSELLEIACSYGFESISLEKYNLQEQAEIFSNSSHVVGTSGAAWVGMIFQQKPIRGLSWLPKVFSQFCSYSTLAGLLGHEINFIEAYIDHNFRSTGEWYEASYYVSPDEFETELKKILASE